MKSRILPILGILAVLFISGCTQTDSSGTGHTKTKTEDLLISSTPDPQNIDSFAGVKEGDMIRFYFTFNDRIGHDGKVNVKVTDNSNKTLYVTEFYLRADQFVDYQFQLTGNAIGKAYEWKVPFNSIQKGTTSMGKAHITFITSSGKTLTDDATFLEIPSYTQQELQQLYENQYLKSAKNVNYTLSIGSFKTTLVRYGYFTYKQYSYGDEVTDFRVDVSAKNVDSEQDSIYTYDAVMIVGDKQYEVKYGGTFDGSNIYPGVVKDGYLLFKDVPAGLTGNAKIVIGSTIVGYYKRPLFEFTVQL